MPAPEPEHSDRPDRPERPERIGILGGTFDPPHVGHVAAATAALEALSLDRLLLVVANDPWQKSPTRQVSAAEDRLALTEAMAAQIPGAEVSRLEVDRGGPSYSIDTVEDVVDGAVAAGRPRPQVFLVVGADLVPDLETWHRADELKGTVTVAMVSRPSTPDPALPPGWQVVRVDGPAVDVSSSEVRQRLAGGHSVNGLVPEPVIRCIGLRALYAVP